MEGALAGGDPVVLGQELFCQLLQFFDFIVFLLDYLVQVLNHMVLVLVLSLELVDDAHVVRGALLYSERGVLVLLRRHVSAEAQRFLRRLQDRAVVQAPFDHVHPVFGVAEDLVVAHDIGRGSLIGR